MLVSESSRAIEIVRALSDKYSRKIVLSIIDKSLTAEELSEREDIPKSTCYRRIHELLRYRIIRVEKTVIDSLGRKFFSYQTSFKSVKINLNSGDITVDVAPIDHPSERLADIWSVVRKGNRLEESAVCAVDKSEPHLSSTR